MPITREDLINAIAADLNIVDGMSTTNAAIAAIGAIEALGFVIVPRVPDEEMINHTIVSSMHRSSIEPREKADIYRWMIAGSPLYRDGVKGEGER